MVNPEMVKIITKKELDSFVNNLINAKKYDVIGVKEKGIRYVFGPLDTAEDLCLDYDVTILPPKKYFLPQCEKLMSFNLKKPFDVKASDSEQPMVIIGIHPYDLIALEQTDKVYLDTQKDDFYKKRKENSILIGVDMQRLHDASFSVNMKTNVTETGFDLLLTNIGGRYAITIGSKKGQDLLDSYANTNPSSPLDIEKIEVSRNKIVSHNQRKMNVDKEDWSKVLVANYDHPIWEKRSEKCMECSSCTMVCPTCFCYEVDDEVSLDLKEGDRVRTWDGCLLRDFSLVAGGEVFRDEIHKRFRHRFFRKGNYLPERYGFIACVGCGRCGIACLPNIADPCTMINDLSPFERTEDVHKLFIKQESEEIKEGVIHIPRPATIANMKKLTEKEMLFEIKLDDNKPLGHDPGQFVEVSIFGIGEAPISVSSGPSDSSTFEMVVRNVGNVSNKLFNMKPGDKLGIRGPLGNGFDMDLFKGKHLLLSAGGIGIVPMRSLIQYVMDKKNRGHFEDVTIMYGAKEPKEVLFSDEVDSWCDIDNVTCELTVDQCSEDDCWTGCTGLITTLYPKIQIDKFDSKNTIAVIIGPPVMYKFVIKCLETLGIPDENIYVSLERRMKCGVGKCGHCQINGVYTCKEGPVFRYDEIKDLPEAFE